MVVRTSASIGCGACPHERGSVTQPKRFPINETARSGAPRVCTRERAHDQSGIVVGRGGGTAAWGRSTRATDRLSPGLTEARLKDAAGVEKK